MAQPGSALAWGARGRWFESSRPDHFLRAEYVISWDDFRSALSWQRSKIYLFPPDGIWNEPLNVLMLPQVQLERDNPAPKIDYGSRVVGRTR